LPCDREHRLEAAAGAGEAVAGAGEGNWRMADAQFQRRTSGNQIVYDIRPAGLLKRSIYPLLFLAALSVVLALAVPAILFLMVPVLCLMQFFNWLEMRKRKPALVTIDEAGMRFASHSIRHEDIAGLAIENNYGNGVTYAPRTVAQQAAVATGVAYEARGYSLFVRVKNSSKRLKIVYGLTEPVADDLMAEMMADLNRY
jgi:hypothetical protein